MQVASQVCHLQEVCVLLEPWYWSHDQRFWRDPLLWNQTLDYVKSSFTHTLHSYWVDAHRNSSKLYNKQPLKCGCGGDGCSNFWSMGVFLCVYTLCVSLCFFFQKKMGEFSHIYKFQSLWHNSYGFREKVLGLLGSVNMFLLFKCVIKVWFLNIHSTNHLASLLPHLSPKHQISYIASRKQLYIY